MPLLSGALALLAGSSARAQQLELRGGVALSSALAREGGAAGTPAPASATAGAAPLLGLTVLLPLRPRTQLEAGAAWAFSRLVGAAGSDSWNTGALGIGQATVGVRYALAGRAYARGGVGVVHYAAARRGIFASGSTFEPALEAGAGWRRQAGRWSLGVELAGQLHAFGTQALHEAGAGGGGVRRLFALVTLGRGVTP